MLPEFSGSATLERFCNSGDDWRSGRLCVSVRNKTTEGLRSRLVASSTAKSVSHSVGDHPDDGCDGNSQAPDARHAAHLTGIGDNSGEHEANPFQRDNTLSA